MTTMIHEFELIESGSESKRDGYWNLEIESNGAKVNEQYKDIDELLERAADMKAKGYRLSVTEVVVKVEQAHVDSLYGFEF